jgi:hypothetical protein
MGGLKPIGSEKLGGMDKIRRIMEIANYNHSLPNKDIVLKSTEYRLPLADGNSYEIVKERQGYIIKRNITESYSDYIEPMKNRRYYRSYSEALKKFNLMAKEFNTLYNNDEGTNLFSEQKKFKLKVPKPKADVAPEEAPTLPEPAPAPATEPAPAPATEPAADPSAEGGDSLDDLMGGGEETPPAGDEEMPTGDEEMPTGDEEMPTGDEEESKGTEKGGVSFKLIQKLTGKLSQKIRKYLNNEEMDSDDVKYILNSIISSLDISVLDDDDVEEIIDRLEGDEENEEGDEEGDEGLGDEDEGDEETPKEEDPLADLAGGDEGEVTEYGYRNRNRIQVGPLGTRTDNMFSESKVDKIIGKYFSITEDEKKSLNNKKRLNENLLKENVMINEMEIKRLSSTISQERAALKFLEKNPKASLIGSTNKKNLLFKVGLNEFKISANGKRVL